MKPAIASCLPNHRSPMQVIAAFYATCQSGDRSSNAQYASIHADQEG
jgi:hypothetical protein